jgi:cytochrome c oxidase assembly protein subunit 11
MAEPAPRRRVRATVLPLAAVVVGMVGLSFASVPLYRLICEATGLGGTTRRAASAPHEIASAVITVRFDAETAPDLGWEFRPLTRELQVHPGEEQEVIFRAVNRTTEAVTGRATYNVAPAKSGIYFDKLQCFCFTEQRLLPGESRDMGVSFFVDPDVLKDPNTTELRAITLSYTMFRVPVSDDPAAAAGSRSAAPTPTKLVTKVLN